MEGTLLRLLIGLTIIILISGCAPSLDIENTVISDKVKACSTGFSGSLQASLDASITKIPPHANANAEFKESAQAAIFAELPETDRLKAYEDYIACVEGTWNQQAKR